MKDWFYRFNTREQLSLLLLGGALLLYLVYMLLWSPLDQRRDDMAQRNVAAALQPILDGFRWLGIHWDEGPETGGPYGPYLQSQRVERYRDAVQELLRRDAAYYDYAQPEEIQS